MNRITIYQGHVIPGLRMMEDESVHLVVTSPPYWGLRDYGLEPQVWGGEAGCGHEWGDEFTAKQSGGGWAKEDGDYQSDIGKQGKFQL
jgi:site-specific DNA-methyltransferase (adenine-specific)